MSHLPSYPKVLHVTGESQRRIRCGWRRYVNRVRSAGETFSPRLRQAWPHWCLISCYSSITERLLRRYGLRAHRRLPSLFEAKRLVLRLAWLLSHFLHIRLDRQEIVGAPRLIVQYDLQLSCGSLPGGTFVRHQTLSSPMRTMQYVAKWARTVPGPPQGARCTRGRDKFGPHRSLVSATMRFHGRLVPVKSSRMDLIPWVMVDLISSTLSCEM